MTSRKTYSDLIKISSFLERYRFLKIGGRIGEETFGGHRSLNQILYKLPCWRRIRKEVILRDKGFDLAFPDHEIHGGIYVHHIEPITIDDILNQNTIVFDMENLISTSFQTHNAIHFGSEESIFFKEPVVRFMNDTIPWR